MNISKTWTSNGNQISVNIEIGSQGTFAGTLTNQAGTFKISRLAVQSGRKCIPFTYKNKPAFQVVPDAIYSEIENALRKSFALTEKEEIEGKIEVAKREYHKALNIGPAEANKWLNEWNSLSAKLRSL